MQYKIEPKDLTLLLALARTGTLSLAGERLGLDGSTVFRRIQRMERGLGQRLFQRGKLGYLPNDICLALVQDAERIEAALESARTTLDCAGEQLAGRVRVSTTDTILHGLLLPILRPLLGKFPLLQLDINASNHELNLNKRETDIALRVTTSPPLHLVGKPLGNLVLAVYAHRDLAKTQQALEQYPWIAVDEELPTHPSVLWRKNHYPNLQPTVAVDSILSVQWAIETGLGIGILPQFLVQPESVLVALTDPLPECESAVWLLTHPDMRHLRRIATVYDHIAAKLTDHLVQIDSLSRRPGPAVTIP